MVRSVVFRYDDLRQLAMAIDASKGQGLHVPEGVPVRDGEWLLAIFELGETKRATAAAGRGAINDEGAVALVFERRDWERLREFATVQSSAPQRPRSAPP
jgi:two-component system phosphate regulon response regulator PhoB